MRSLKSNRHDTQFSEVFGVPGRKRETESRRGESESISPKTPEVTDVIIGLSRPETETPDSENDNKPDGVSDVTPKTARRPEPVISTGTEMPEMITDADVKFSVASAVRVMSSPIPKDSKDSRPKVTDEKSNGTSDEIEGMSFVMK